MDGCSVSRRKICGITIDTPEAKLREDALWVENDPDLIVSVSLPDPIGLALVDLARINPKLPLTLQQRRKGAQSGIAPEFDELAFRIGERVSSITISFRSQPLELVRIEPTDTLCIRNLTWEEAQRIHERPKDPFHHLIVSLAEAAEHLRADRRSAMGARANARCQNGSSFDASGMVAEVMFAVNRLLAQFMLDCRIPAIFQSILPAKAAGPASIGSIDKLFTRLLQLLPRAAGLSDSDPCQPEDGLHAKFSANAPDAASVLPPYARGTAPLREAVDRINLTNCAAHVGFRSVKYSEATIAQFVKRLNGGDTIDIADPRLPNLSLRQIDTVVASACRSGEMSERLAEVLCQRARRSLSAASMAQLLFMHAGRDRDCQRVRATVLAALQKRRLAPDVWKAGQEDCQLSYADYSTRGYLFGEQYVFVTVARAIRLGTLYHSDCACAWSRPAAQGMALSSLIAKIADLPPIDSENYADYEVARYEEFARAWTTRNQPPDPERRLKHCCGARGWIIEPCRIRPASDNTWVATVRALRRGDIFCSDEVTRSTQAAAKTDAYDNLFAKFVAQVHIQGRTIPDPRQRSLEDYTVQTLLQFCAQHGLPTPIFETESERSDRVEVVCRLVAANGSSVETEGDGSAVCVAQRWAAKRMLARLTPIIDARRSKTP